jgi:hypothetical protein
MLRTVVTSENSVPKAQSPSPKVLVISTVHRHNAFWTSLVPRCLPRVGSITIIQPKVTPADSHMRLHRPASAGISIARSAGQIGNYSLMKCRAGPHRRSSMFLVDGGLRFGLCSVGWAGEAISDKQPVNELCRDIHQGPEM